MPPPPHHRHHGRDCRLQWAPPPLPRAPVGAPPPRHCDAVRCLRHPPPFSSRCNPTRLRSTCHGRSPRVGGGGAGVPPRAWAAVTRRPRPNLPPAPGRCVVPLPDAARCHRRAPPRFPPRHRHRQQRPPVASLPPPPRAPPPLPAAVPAARGRPHRRALPGLLLARPPACPPRPPPHRPPATRVPSPLPSPLPVRPPHGVPPTDGVSLTGSGARVLGLPDYPP